MFSAGPELPGWNYSDELFNIVMKNKMTPQAAVDLKAKWEEMAAEYGRTDVSVRLFEHSNTQMQNIKSL